MTTNQFLESFVSLSVQVALVVPVTHWLGRFVRGERARCRLWGACYAVVLVLMVAAVTLPHPRIVQPWANVDSQTGAALARVEMHIGWVALTLWFPGVPVFLGMFLVRSFCVQRFLRKCESFDVAELRQAGIVLSYQDEDTGRRRKPPVRFLRSTSLVTPFCWQFHRPYIVLPSYLLAGNSEELNMIVRHELEHLRTGHPLQLFLQRVVEAVFWYHPMVWWASEQSALAREFACDEAAVGSRSEIAIYLRSLLKIVERAESATDDGLTALAFGGTKSAVAARARRLVHIANNGSFDGKASLQTAGALAGLGCIAALIASLWLPVDVLASPRSGWSPWPRWTAAVLHDFGVPVRDFERYDNRFQLRDFLEAEHEDDADGNVDSLER